MAVSKWNISFFICFGKTHLLEIMVQSEKVLGKTGQPDMVSLIIFHSLFLAALHWWLKILDRKRKKVLQVWWLWCHPRKIENKSICYLKFPMKTKSTPHSTKAHFRSPHYTKVQSFILHYNTVAPNTVNCPTLPTSAPSYPVVHPPTQ